jgi:hypothetical protein
MALSSKSSEQQTLIRIRPEEQKREGRRRENGRRRGTYCASPIQLINLLPRLKMVAMAMSNKKRGM